MENKDLVRLKHMLDSAQAIISFAKNRTRKDLDTNRMFLSGVLREFEILGEAAGQVSLATKKQIPLAKSGILNLAIWE
jgi:uncharacterized protein with HEPN domain